MRNTLLATTLALSLAAALPAGAQPAPAGAVVTTNQPGEVSVVSAIEAAARVTAIDKGARMLTLTGPEGRSFNVVAGPEVRNFAQIAVGDDVVVEYIRAVSLQVQKNSGLRQRSERSGGARAEQGSKPGVILGHEIRVLADVIGVDTKKSTITLRTPDGRVVELDVKNPEHFKAVKVGDQIEANYLESVAIAVQPAAPAKQAGK